MDLNDDLLDYKTGYYSVENHLASFLQRILNSIIDKLAVTLLSLIYLFLLGIYYSVVKEVMPQTRTQAKP